MTRFRLSPLAEETLEDIFVYTFATFGEEQAIEYREALFARLEALAENRPPHGRACSVLVGDDTPMDLFYVKQGNHFLVYRKMADDIVVVDFIHERRDLPNLIRVLIGKDM
jgi:plasmid stabilization system protein ParE